MAGLITSLNKTDYKYDGYGRMCTSCGVGTWVFADKTGIVEVDGADVWALGYWCSECDMLQPFGNSFGKLHAGKICKLITAKLIPTVKITAPIANPIKYFDYKPEYKLAKLCECGAHKLGIEDYMAGHSHWCPAGEKYSVPYTEENNVIAAIKAHRKP